MSKTTKYNVTLAQNKAQRAVIQGKIDKLLVAKGRETNKAKKAQIHAQIVELKFDKDQIRGKKRNGTGKKKSRRRLV